MSALNVVLVKKEGNNRSEMYPLTQDSRVDVTSDSSKLPSGIETLEDLINALGTLAFEDYVALNVSTENNYGLVKITNVDSESATDTVPSAKLLHDGLAGKVGTTGAENITGLKTFADGIAIGSSTNSMTYDSVSDTFTYGPPISNP